MSSLKLRTMIQWSGLFHRQSANFISIAKRSTQPTILYRYSTEVESGIHYAADGTESAFRSPCVMHTVHLVNAWKTCVQREVKRTEFQITGPPQFQKLFSS